MSIEYVIFWALVAGFGLPPRKEFGNTSIAAMLLKKLGLPLNAYMIFISFLFLLFVGFLYSASYAWILVFLMAAQVLASILISQGAISFHA